MHPPSQRHRGEDFVQAMGWGNSTQQRVVPLPMATAVYTGTGGPEGCTLPPLPVSANDCGRGHLNVACPASFARSPLQLPRRPQPALVGLRARVVHRPGRILRQEQDIACGSGSKGWLRGGGKEGEGRYGIEGGGVVDPLPIAFTPALLTSTEEKHLPQVGVRGAMGEGPRGSYNHDGALPVRSAHSSSSMARYTVSRDRPLVTMCCACTPQPPPAHRQARHFVPTAVARGALVSRTAATSGPQWQEHA
jgi:hypothetical protein